jgi:hypothetical protein
MRYALLAFAAFVAGSCHQISEDPPAPETIKTCHLDRVVLHVTWHDSVDGVAKHCTPKRNSILYGCARSIYLGDDERHAYLHFVKPKDFNDKGALAVMGHELCHALGGEHE